MVDGIVPLYVLSKAIRRVIPCASTGRSIVSSLGVGQTQSL